LWMKDRCFGVAVCKWGRWGRLLVGGVEPRRRERLGRMSGGWVILCIEEEKTRRIRIRGKGKEDKKGGRGSKKKAAEKNEGLNMGGMTML